MLFSKNKHACLTMKNWGFELMPNYQLNKLACKHAGFVAVFHNFTSLAMSSSSVHTQILATRLMIDWVCDSIFIIHFVIISSHSRFF